MSELEEIYPLWRKSDEELIRKWYRGDKQAGYVLIRRYQDQLWRFVYKKTGNYQDTCDVFQETWCRIFQHISKGLVIECENLLPLLYKTVKNIKIDEFRRNAVRDRAIEKIHERDTSNKEKDPVEATIKAESTEKLLLALSKLPEKERRAIELRFFPPCLNLNSIAMEMGVSLGTAHNCIERAKNNLRCMLEKEK